MIFPKYQLQASNCLTAGSFLIPLELSYAFGPQWQHCYRYVINELLYKWNLISLLISNIDQMVGLSASFTWSLTISRDQNFEMRVYCIYCYDPRSVLVTSIYKDNFKFAFLLISIWLESPRIECLIPWLLLFFSPIIRLDRSK